MILSDFMDRPFFMIVKKIFKTNWRWKSFISINKKRVIYNFRKNDIENGGEGAPLTPIFHN